MTSLVLGMGNDRHSRKREVHQLKESLLMSLEDPYYDQVKGHKVLGSFPSDSSRVMSRVPKSETF